MDYFAFRRVLGQLPVLDGLRGVAVILVLLRHAAYMGPEQPHGQISVLGFDVSVFMLNGWIGVDLFFVLSGFLISHHIIKLNERHDGALPWKVYLAKRGLRIVPAYYAVLFLVVLGAFPYYDIGDNLLGPRVVYHMLFFQDYLPANIVIAFWSMGVEEKFYIIAPFLVLGCMKRSTIRGRVALPLLFVAIGLMCRSITMFAHPEDVEYVQFFRVFRSPFHMTLDPILVGVVLAFVYRSRGELPRLTARGTARLVFWSGVAGFVFLTTSENMMAQITWWDKTLQPLAITLCFGAMVFGLLFDGGPRALFASRFLFFFARISFCLYLVHVPLIPSAKVLAEQLGSSEQGFGTFFSVFVTLSILGALVIHYVVEKPFLKLKDRIR